MHEPVTCRDSANKTACHVAKELKMELVVDLLGAGQKGCDSPTAFANLAARVVSILAAVCL